MDLERVFKNFQTDSTEISFDASSVFLYRTRTGEAAERGVGF
jgi:hypothetical protein